MVHMVESTLRKLHRVGKSAPHKVLQRRDLGNSIGQGLSLSNLYDLGPRSPEISQSEDDGCPGENLFQCFIAGIEVCGLDIDPFSSEF